MTNNWSAMIGSVLCLGLGIPAAASAQSYSFQIFDAPGAAGTELTGITSSGQLAGNTLDANRQRHGFTSDGTTVVTLGSGSERYEVYGMNEAGDLSGRYQLGFMPAHGFVQRAGAGPVTFDIPGCALTQGSGIGSSGQVCGICFTAAGGRGFVRSADGTQFDYIDFPGAQNTLAYASHVNTSTQALRYGVVGGGWFDGVREHGFYADGFGSYFNIDPPGAVSTEVRAVDDLGNMAGWYQTADGHVHGFVSGSTTVTVDVPGQRDTQVFGWDANGDLVGATFGTDGVSHGFIATPM